MPSRNFRRRCPTSASTGRYASRPTADRQHRWGGRVNNGRYFAASAWLGALWGVVGYSIMSIGALARQPEWRLGGLLASPLIGVLAGMLYVPAYQRRSLIRVLAAGATLYVTATCFAAAGGFLDMITRGVSPMAAFGTVWVPLDDNGTNLRLGSSFITTPVSVTLWGLAFTGYVLILWPLAFFCRRVLGPRGGSPTMRGVGRRWRGAAERQHR